MNILEYTALTVDGSIDDNDDPLLLVGIIVLIYSAYMEIRMFSLEKTSYSPYGDSYFHCVDHSFVKY